MFNFLVLSWALSLGIVPQQDDQVRDREAIIEKSQIATIAGVKFGVTAWDRLHVYSEVNTFQYLNAGKGGFNPYRADYIFGADFYFNDFVSVSFVHECDHPIISGTSYISRYPYLADETKLFLTIGNERK